MRERIVYVFVFMILFSIPGLTFAQEEPFVDDISISTDKLLYSVGETIVISGEVTNKKMPVVAIRIFDPEDRILGAYSVEIDETNHFTKTIITDVPFYEKSGIYTIILEYGKLTTATVFEIENITGEVTDFPPEEEESTTILPEVIFFESDKKKYQNEDTIFINGKVSTFSIPQVTVAIFDPYEVPAGIYLAPVNPDLTFSTSFLARYSVNFKIEGTYSITAQYGGSETRKNIEIEFFEKLNTNASNPEPNITENSDIEVSYSFLLSESDLENLATWYYLDGSDDQLATLFHNLLNRGLIDPDVNERITKNALILWIQNTEIPLGIAIDDLFSEDISEEEFFTIIENSLEEHINKLEEKSRISEILNPLPTNPSPKAESNEIKSSESKNEISQKIDYIEDEDDETETVYIDSSENCKIRLYEDIVTFYNNPGPALARLCKYEDAIFNYDQTLSSNPTHVIALTNKGAALASLGRYQQAIESYDKVLEVDPDNVNALNNKGNALSSLSRYQEALEIYDKVLEVDPDNEIVLTNKEKASSFLTVYHIPEAEPEIIMISDESLEDIEIKPDEKLEKDDDIVTQFAKVFSSISASLISLFSG
ncbi:MAG: tetratricopeptide repeat protein [Nitrosopumilaceae archaeon]